MVSFRPPVVDAELMTNRDNRDSERRPRVTYDAPIASLEFAAFDAEGNSYEITACHDCLPWRAEVVLDVEDGKPVVREWHAVECPLYIELLEEFGQ